MKPKGTTMLEEIEQAVREYKSDDSIQVTPTTTFSEIGLDSLDTVELFMQLEDRLGVTIELNGEINNFADLVEAIEKVRV